MDVWWLFNWFMCWCKQGSADVWVSVSSPSNGSGGGAESGGSSPVGHLTFSQPDLLLPWAPIPGRFPLLFSLTLTLEVAGVSTHLATSGCPHGRHEQNHLVLLDAVACKEEGVPKLLLTFAVQEG